MSRLPVAEGPLEGRFEAPAIEPFTRSSLGVSLEKQAILARLDGNEDLFNKICESFIRLLPGQLAVIAEAISTGDKETLSRSIHRLKGSVAYFDIDGAVTETIRAMGQILAKPEFDTDNARTLYETLVRQIDELNQKLKSMRS